MTNPHPDFRIVERDRGRGQDVSGLWMSDGKYHCECEVEYSNYCEEVWLTVHGITTNGTEWTFAATDLNTITTKIAGEEIQSNLYRTLKNGKEFWREEVIEAMTRCYERYRQANEEEMRGAK